MNQGLHSYPKVYNMGHRVIRDLFDGPVVIQEKMDGSQFSFGVVDGELRMRSRRREIHGVEEADKLFRMACEIAQALFDTGLLDEGWTYRGEAITTPRHNTLEYERIPKGGFILFDIDTGLEDYLGPDELAGVAEALGVEVVPTLYAGEVLAWDELEKFLERSSCLGDKIEGIVVKNQNRFAEDGKMLMGKLVTAEFREAHTGQWKKTNPTRTEVIASIIHDLRTEARWEKAIQHLRDDGTLGDALQDIGKLVQEVQQDILQECGGQIAERLFTHFWNQIRRGVVSGFPEFYKRKLADAQFPDSDEEAS